MANKRAFKKYAEALGATICEEMMMVYYNVEGADQDKIAKAIEKVLGTTSAAKSNANITFDKGVRAFENYKEYSEAKKSFFRAMFNKISVDFSQQIDEALKLFNSAVPAAAKESNKAAATE